MNTTHPQPAEPPPGPTPKKKIQLYLVAGGLVILITSLLFSNTGNSAKKSKLYGGQQQQQPASPNDVKSFDAESRAQAERERLAAALAKKRQEVDAALQAGQQAPVDGTPTAMPCQYTAQGCYGSQTPHTASAADTAAAERKARRERQLHASTLALELMPEAPVQERGAENAKSNAEPSVVTGKSKDTALVETAADKKTSVAPYDAWAGKLYRIFEGTLLEVVVKNRINGDAAGPIEALLSNDIYSLNGQHLLLPRGTVLLGEARAVNQQFQQRLFVAFHRLICPDGFSVNLDQFQGLTQRGDVGLQDQVNHHYVSIFGTAIALAAIGGVANIGNGTSGLSYDPSVQFRAGIASQTGQAADRILDRYLNRLPTLVIREGARSRIFVSQDFVVPGYADHRMDPTL